MSAGLYSSIYGKTAVGIYDDLYGRRGASPPIKSMDIRLGGFGDAEAGTSLFARQIAGIPLWLVGISLVGFAYVLRKRKQAA